MVQFKEDARYFWHSHPAIKSCLKIIMCPIFWPCFICLACAPTSNPYRIPKRRRRRIEREWNLSTIAQSRRERRVKNRKRSLSIGGKRKRDVHEQHESPMFAMFPPEIRLKIYEMVLCESGRVHIHRTIKVTDQFAQKSTTCIAPEDYGAKHLSCSIEEKRDDQPRIVLKKRVNTLSLLITCRKM